MTGKGLLFVLLFVHLFSSLSAEEPFRTFTTASGSSLELKLIGYEGQTFFLVDKKGQRYSKFKDFSKTDQFYLIEASKGFPKENLHHWYRHQNLRCPQKEKGSIFIRKSCLSCSNVAMIATKPPYEENGRTKNPKAGLRFDSYEWLMKGSEDIGPVIEAGDTAGSILFEVITLPPDDDMIMPPKGDPLTAEQIDLFRRWILEGATEKPTGKVVSSAVASSSTTVTENGKDENDDKIHKSTPQEEANLPPRFFLCSCGCPIRSKPR